jgi:hypothetical protein
VNAQTLTAVAAISAAIISLINVALTAIFAQHQAGVRWLRELLPGLIGEFADAAFRLEYVIFETDWTKLAENQQEELGREEFRKAVALRDKLETFASPETIAAAEELMSSIEAIRFASFNRIQAGDFDIWHPTRRSGYWAYAEAHHKFMKVARKEMGLKAPPVPPGLANQRKAQAAANVTTVSELWYGLMGPSDPYQTDLS